MEPSFQPMSLPDYATLQTELGAKIVLQKGLYWRQVRPFVYRPLLPTEPLTEPVAPPGSWPVVYQYAVADPQRANSTLNFLLLENRHGYSLADVNHKRRHLLKRAAQQFQVRPIVDPEELKREGHRVYLSFYERTRYAYRSDRRNKRIFDRWVDSLFTCRNQLLLGGYGPHGLVAISNAFWVHHTLIHATLMCDTPSLKLNLVDLMFHELRLLAGRQTGLHQIFARSYQGGTSLDQYYLHRGCRLVRQPARLEMPTSLRAGLSRFLPRPYALLCGAD